MKEAQIYIFGTIGEFDGVPGVTLQDVITQVNANKDAEKIVVKIKSPGGDFDLGFDIYNYLRSLGKPIDTVAVGMVASIASVIMMAGDNRIMSPDSQIMIHNPWMKPEGGFDASALNKMAAWMLEAENQLLAFYAKQTNNTKEAIRPLMKAETVLDAEQAKNLGFATEVMVEMPMALAYKKQKTSKMSKPKSNQNILAAVLDFLNGDKPEVKNLMVNVANGQLDFFELEDDATMIAVGAQATFDGEPAQGEYVDEAGRIFVFEAGVLNEIRDPESEVIEDDMDIEAMINQIIEKASEQAFAKISAKLEEKLGTIEAAQTEIKTTLSERKSVFDGLKNLIGQEIEDPKGDPKRSKENKQDPEHSIFAAGFAKHKNN